MSLAEFCASGKDVVPFFRSMLAELASRGVSDYRLKLCPAPPPSSSFSVTVRPDNGQKHGPRQFAFCLSCDPEQATIAECNYQGGEKQRGPEGGLPERLRSLTSGVCEWKVPHAASEFAWRVVATDSDNADPRAAPNAWHVIADDAPPVRRFSPTVFTISRRIAHALLQYASLPCGRPLIAACCRTGPRKAAISPGARSEAAISGVVIRTWQRPSAESFRGLRYHCPSLIEAGSS